MEVQVDLSRVVFSETDSDQSVQLRERGGTRAVPIVIGRFESEAIMIGLSGELMPRPLTHDLILGVIKSLNGRLNRIVVDDLKTEPSFLGGIFTAKLHIDTERGDVVIDCRPSDAISLLVRSNCDIFVEERVFEKLGQAE